MLKRQRPSTPPASLEASPSNFSDADCGNYDVKRRRIVAPILDGRQRGLRKEADEEWLDEDNESLLDTSATNSTADFDWTNEASQYKHTNALLHQLHLEHQRRSQTVPSQMLGHAPRNSDVVPSFPGQRAKSVSLGAPARFPDEELSQHVKVEEESHQVRVHYEEHNRQLGSLVRRRMQEQHPNSE